MKKQKLNVRMPQHVHLELAEIAYENGLSMNALAVMALQNFIGYVCSHGRLPGTHKNPKRGREKAIRSFTKTRGRNGGEPTVTRLK